jgi:PilZ domain
VAFIHSTPQAGKGLDPAAPNQRASVRYRCPPASAGRVYLAEDLEFQRAWLHNLSAAGIGLVLSKPLEHGLFLTIQLKSSTSKKGYSLPAHAIHSTQQAGGDWLVGCEFVVPLTNEDLDNLL